MLKYKLFFALLLSFYFFSCEKGSKTVDNPYDKIVRPVDTSGNVQYDATSIQGLHKDIFKPTCANSGCHDGTFEPDFRTAQSSYNTLVNIKPIKNDQGGTFNARVVPGNADASILIYRMTVDLGGNSGIMPLVVNPGNPYDANKLKHIENIKKWINKGAPDLAGNAPKAINFPPQILGVIPVVSGAQVGRSGIYETMNLQSGASVDLYFSLSDDNVAQENLTGMSINWSTDPAVYDAGNEKPLTKLFSDATYKGIFGTDVKCRWKYTFSTGGLKQYDVIWFRISCSDGVNTGFTVPNNFSLFPLKKYFAIKIL